MNAAKVIEVGEEAWHHVVIESDVPVVVDFRAEWCGPCRTLEPLLRELADEFEGRARVVALDIDRDGAIAARYNVRAIPAIVMFQGGEPRERIVGTASLPTLRDRLRAYMA